MANYKLTLAYDGTNYNGWQKQGNTSNTIEEKINFHLSNCLGETIEVIGSGRTDSGVHANQQVANFHSNIALDPDSFLSSINNELPKDIRITSLESVDERFHSRLNAISKTYIYYIDTNVAYNVFRRKYTYQIADTLDLSAMKEAVSHLLGEHDFKSFCSIKNTKKSTLRTIYSIDITEENGIISMKFNGNGFLYNMVRILSGTLINVGLDKTKPTEIPSIIEGKNRNLAGPMAPANGLFLDDVSYSN